MTYGGANLWFCMHQPGTVPFSCHAHQQPMDPPVPMQRKRKAEEQAADLRRKAETLASEGKGEEAAAQRVAAAVLLRHSVAAEEASAALQRTLAATKHVLAVAEAQEGAVREQVRTLSLCSCHGSPSFSLRSSVCECQ
jgi:hypothetical protein